jgi:drug/metabolite transporter (DMT)-like permease
VTVLGPVCALASSFTWAFASSRYAEASRGIDGVRVNYARALFATTAWTAYGLVSMGGSLFDGVTSQGALWLGLSIVCSYVLGDGVFYAAARRVGVPTALAVATVYPLWAALYGVLFRAETLGLVRGLGLAGSVLGVIGLLRLSSLEQTTPPRAEEARPVSSDAALGIGIALLTSLFWAGNAVFLKQGAEGLSVGQANVVRFGIGALLLTGRVLWAARGPANRGVPMASVVGSLRVPLFVDTVCGSIFYVYGLANSDLALGVTLSSLSPLAALPMAVLSGRERLRPPRVLCVCVIVASVVALVVG